MKLGLLIGIISFNSCGSINTKPSIDSGIMLPDLNEVFFVNNQTSEERSIPIITDGQCTINKELNKSIVHSNKDWNKVLLYIRLLERNSKKEDRIKYQKTIERELKKILTVNQIMEERIKAYGI